MAASKSNVLVALGSRDFIPLEHISVSDALTMRATALSSEIKKVPPFAPLIGHVSEYDIKLDVTCSSSNSEPTESDPSPMRLFGLCRLGEIAVVTNSSDKQNIFVRVSFVLPDGTGKREFGRDISSKRCFFLASDHLSHSPIFAGFAVTGTPPSKQPIGGGSGPSPASEATSPSTIPGED